MKQKYEFNQELLTQVIQADVEKLKSDIRKEFGLEIPQQYLDFLKNTGFGAVSPAPMVSNIDNLCDIYSPNELYSPSVGDYGVAANTKDVRGVWEVPDPVDLSKYIVIGCSSR